MQGIIYRSPWWDKPTTRRKQRMKKTLHFSLQNQIRLTTAVVRKRGRPQSSIVSYRKLVGIRESPKGGSGFPAAEAAGAEGERELQELHGRVPPAAAYGCTSASRTLQHRSGANLIPTSAFPCVQQHPRAAPAQTWRPAAKHRHYLRVLLCFVSVWPSLRCSTRSERKSHEQASGASFWTGSFCRGTVEQRENVLSCNQTP